MTCKEPYEFDDQSTGRRRGPLAGRARQAIVVNAHPGGRFPGVSLPADWFTLKDARTEIPPALPAPGDQRRNLRRGRHHGHRHSQRGPGRI